MIENQDVAIIVPTYNEPARCIEKLIALPAMAAVAEVIVVDASDDSSCRQSLAGLAKTTEVQLITAAEKGRSAQMNQGAAQAKAPILLFLHADTQLPTTAAETAVSAIEAGYHWGRFATQLLDARWQFRVIEWAMNKRSAVTHVATGDQALFMTREAFALVAGFDALPLMEDVAMSKKLKSIGPICAVPLAVQTSARRWQQHGIFKTTALMWWLRWRYFLGTPAAQLAKYYPQPTRYPVYLFAKAPVPGAVKSRLCPPLNIEQAAAVATVLLQLTAEKLFQHWQGKTWLAVTPDATHTAFAQLQQNYGMPPIRQNGKNLGKRMLNAIADGLTRAPAAAVIGADIPGITAAILNEAYRRMQAGKCVLGPTSDGGFYFLALNTADDGLFADIQWGSDSVYAQLLHNAAELDIKLSELPMLQDCDRSSDLQDLITQDPSLGALIQQAGVDIGLVMDGEAAASG